MFFKMKTPCGAFSELYPQRITARDNRQIQPAYCIILTIFYSVEYYYLFNLLLPLSHCFPFQKYRTGRRLEQQGL
jgi:hypothetical protein